MKQLSEQEIDRLQTKARAATTLRAELDSLSRSARRLSRLTIEGRLRSMIDRYDHSTGALSAVRIQQGMAAMMRDAIENPPEGMKAVGQVHDEIIFAPESHPAGVSGFALLPLGPMQRKSLRMLDGMTERPTLEDLQEENAQNDYGRSAVADVANQVYRTKPDADWKPLESAVKTCIGILNANLPAEKLHKTMLDPDLPTDVKPFVRAEAILLCKQGRVVDAIRYVRDTVPCSLRGAKLYVDSVRGL